MMQLKRLTAAATVSVLGGVGVVVVPLGVAQADEAGWGPTVNLTVPLRAVRTPEVAIGPKGAATAIWVRGSRDKAVVYRSVRHHDGSWGEPARVPGTRGVGEAKVAIAGDGERILVWTAGRTVKAARRAPGEAWSSPVVLHRTSNPLTFAVDLRLALNARGRAVVAWQTVWADVPAAGTTTSVGAVVGRAGGSWTAVKRLSSLNRSAGGPEVGIDRAGRVTVVWGQWTRRSHRVMTASRAPGQAWGASRALTPGKRVGRPQLAVAESGRVAVAWSDGEQTSGRIKVRRWGESSGWSVPDTMPDHAGGVGWLDIGMDATGTVTFAWSTARAAVRSATQSLEGAWTRDRVAPAGSVFYGVNLVVNRAGDAVVGWESVDEGEHPVQAAWRTPDGPWSPVTSLSVVPGDAFGPALALDGNGDVVAAWTYLRDITTAAQIQARSFQAP